MKALAARITEIQAGVEKMIADATIPPSVKDMLRDADYALQAAFLRAEFGEDQ